MTLTQDYKISLVVEKENLIYTAAHLTAEELGFFIGWRANAHRTTLIKDFDQIQAWFPDITKHRIEKTLKSLTEQGYIQRLRLRYGGMFAKTLYVPRMNIVADHLSEALFDDDDVTWAGATELKYYYGSDTLGIALTVKWVMDYEYATNPREYG